MVDFTPMEFDCDTWVAVISARGIESVGRSRYSARDEFDKLNPRAIYPGQFMRITNGKSFRLMQSGAHRDDPFLCYISRAAAESAYKDGRYDERFRFDEVDATIRLTYEDTPTQSKRTGFKEGS